MTLGEVVMKLVANTQGFTSGLQGATQRFQSFTKGISDFGSQMSTRVSLPLAAVGGAAMHLSMDFDHAMKKMVALAGVAPEQAKAWRKDIMQLASDTGIASDKLGEAMFYVASGGIKGAEAFKVLTAAAQGSMAGMGDVATLAQASTFAMNAYGQENLKAADAVGIMAAVVREGNVASEEVAGSFGRVLPIAASMGVSFQDLGGTIASMTRQGLDANLAVTATRAVLAALLTPTRDSAVLLRLAGTSFEEIRRVVREKGLLSGLMLISRAFEVNSDAIAAVFPDFRSLLGILNLVANDGRIAGDIMSRMATSGLKDLKYATDQFVGSSGLQLKRLWIDLKNLGVEVGDMIAKTLTPAFGEISKALKGIGDALNGINPKGAETIVKVGMGIVLLGPGLKLLGFSLGIVAGGIKMLVGAVLGLATATQTVVMFRGATWAAVGGLKGLMALAKTGPLAFAGLVAAVAAVSWEIGGLINKWLELEKHGNDMKDPITQRAAELAKSKELYEEVGTRVGHLADELGLTSLALMINSKHTKENASILAQVEQAVLREAHARVIARQAALDAATATKGLTDAQRAAAEAAKALAQESARLSETYGTFNADQLTKAMDAVMVDFVGMVKTGVPAAQAIATLKGRVAELSNAAKTFGGTFIKPRQFEDLEEAIGSDTRSGFTGSVEALGASLARLAQRAKDGFDGASLEVVKFDGVTTNTVRNIILKWDSAGKAVTDLKKVFTDLYGGVDTSKTFTGPAIEELVKFEGKTEHTIRNIILKWDEAGKKITDVGKVFDELAGKKAEMVVRVDADFSPFRSKCKLHGVDLSMWTY
jgi:hypothetical protein